MAPELETIHKTIFDIQTEVQNLRSFVIGIAGKDEEGEYRPDFVNKILKENQEEAPFIFRDKKDFLKTN